MTKAKEAEITEISGRKINLKNDGDLLISEGASRFEKSWRNKKIRWSTLLARLSKSRASGETHAEYMKLPKAQQDKLKDIGGFVGGYLTEGHRKNGSVKARQIVTLDADFASPDFWERAKSVALDGIDSCAMCVYSTHKHSEGKPRLRLIIPLESEVTPDQYEAIARKIAETIGIDSFDDSTYQAARLMYWPSHSSDVVPVFEYVDAPFLQPDAILAQYHEWSDVSEWPMSSRELEIRKKLADKQEDPTTKKGIVGIFCRTYTVTEAIRKFLPDIYTPTAKEDRWTYAAGSTAGGLVIYDGDLFAFSNHGTDPAGGQLCNAFDLVRIHKFEQQDEGSEDKPMNRRPSWKAMQELVQDDPACIRTHDEDAAADFADGLPEEDWKLELIRDANLKPTTAVVNAELILENQEELQGVRLNEMNGRIEADGLPWADGRVQWSDTHDAILIGWIAKSSLKVEFPPAKIRQALAAVSYRRRYHPVKHYLESLPEWDGVERVDRLLIEYLWADDNIYVREVTRKTLVAAVARVFEPGCKFDQMLVLVGPQGAGKSSLFSSLAGEWFSDSLKMDMMNRIKDAGEQIQGKWIVEIGEMSGMKKADIEAVKSFVSRRSDDYRNAYGHYAEDRPRQCIIVGSTNSEDGFLRDITGNRRFWPVNIRKGPEVRTVNISRKTIDQIWAEAKILYETGESLILSPETEAMAVEAQREAMEQDDRQGIVEEYLDRLVPENWDQLTYDQRMVFLGSEDEGTKLRKTISNIEIWAEALHGSRDRMESKDSYAIAKIMAKIPGWTRTSERTRVSDYGRQRIYRRKVINI